MARVAIFNHPKWSSGALVKTDRLILDTVAALIGQAPPGCQVRATVTGWDVRDSQVESEPIFNALLAAQGRGCDVKAVLPGLWVDDPDDPEDFMHWYQMSSGWRSIGMLHEAYRGNLRHWPGSQELCQNLNHNKFVLFSHLDTGGGGGPRWVIANMSCNWRYRDIDRPNDLLVISDERTLYLAFLRYWQSLWMAAGKAQSIAKFAYKVDDAANHSRAYFFPLPDGWSDPVMDLLNSVVPSPTSRVRVAMSTWNYAGRGKSITDKLVALADAGADVRVIGHHELDLFDDKRPWMVCTIDPRDPNAEGVGYCETSQAVWERLGNSSKIRWAKSGGVHSKYVLVDSVLSGRGDAPHQVVMTGPINFGNPITYGACAMAENLIVLEDDAEIYQRYLENWEWNCKECFVWSDNDPCGP
ncbi:MAG: hypothetical protein H6711_16220 [Myxococcales bacterium]|nr:hypothetical protein [Myxococcales bacterium]